MKKCLMDKEEIKSKSVPAVVEYPTRMLFALEEAFREHADRGIDKWFRRSNETYINPF